MQDPGNTKSRTKRQIQLVLVEKGTGFILWSDVIDNLSKYTRQGGPFHTMHLSSDHSSRIGFSFDDSEAADEFHQHLLRLTSDPLNIALSGPRSPNKKSGSYGTLTDSDQRSRRKYRPPSKSEISQPCAFQHVVNVSQNDVSKYFSLQAFVRAKVEIIDKLNTLSVSSSSNINNIQNVHRTSTTNNVHRNVNVSSNINGHNSSNMSYKRATSIRNFPKSAPPPPPPPTSSPQKRLTSASCHDLSTAS